MCPQCTLQQLDKDDDCLRHHPSFTCQAEIGPDVPRSHPIQEGACPSRLGFTNVSTMLLAVVAFLEMTFTVKTTPNGSQCKNYPHRWLVFAPFTYWLEAGVHV